VPRSFRSNRALGILPDVRFPLRESARGAGLSRCPERARAELPAEQNWWASGLRYRRSPNRSSAGLHADNGTLRRPHQMRPQLGDSAGRRSAANREQRCAALGAVALPAGTTVGQRHLPRVGDRDLLTADTSALWAGFRRLWVPCARFNHGPPAYSRAIGFLAGGANQPRRTCGRSIRWRGSSVHWVCCEGLPASCHEPVTCVKAPTAQDHSQGSHRSPRLPVGSRTTARSRRPVSPRVRLREYWRCQAACRGRDSR
jgi:hypothetical protein